MKTIDRDFTVKQQLTQLMAEDICNKIQHVKSKREKYTLLKSLKKDVLEKVLQLIDLKSKKNMAEV